MTGRSFTPEQVRRMPLSEALRTRAEVRQQLRRSAWRGQREGRDGAARLLLLLDERIGSDETRLHYAATLLYGEREAKRRFGGDA